jgi:hypothetical protein
MMTATTSNHPLGRRRALIVIPIALVLLAIPILLFRSSGSDLIDDTRAYFGAGSAADVPTVTQVSCVASRSGSNSSRGIGMTDYGCSLYLAAGEEPPRDDPFKTLPYDEAMREWSRRTMAQMKAINDPANRIPSTIERSLATNRSGDLPTLRRLTAEGQPQRFGVVWGGDELTLRWARMLLLFALFWGPALGSLYLARKIWREGR